MATNHWSFGPFVFGEREFRLLRSGLPVSIQQKPLDLLACLLEAPGALVPRDVIAAALYPDTTVSPQALRNVVLKLREALGPEHEAWVETVPARGIRFSGPVTVERDVALAAPGVGGLYLPAERDRFVGRASDGEAIAIALDEARLVSLVGPGGVGKTRLAIHHGWQSVDGWPGGVWFCDLTDARSADAVVATVGAVLDVPLGAGDPIVRIGHAIATRGRCLVVLDNFEQLVAEAEPLIGAWLDRAPEVWFLVTSRTVLQLPGERVVDLAPLDADDAEMLFVARARAADPRWVAPEPAVVAALVAMLDALPLAIELAASRVRVMSVEALTLRMGERFELLKSSGKVPSRHATLRATLDDSWALLSEAERHALAQLSVFDGGFSFAAAEHVLQAAGGWPIDLVQGLVDQSLVRFVRHERSAGGAVDRFELLATVRDYAAERLAERGTATAEARHGSWFAGWGRETLRGFDAAEVLAPELANLVVACRRAIARGDVGGTTATLEAAWTVLDTRGPLALGLALADAALERFDEQAEPWFVRGCAVSAVGRSAEALTAFERAAVLAERAGDRVLVGRIAAKVAGEWMAAGRREEARRALDLALTELRSGPYAAMVLERVAVLHRLGGQLEASRATFEDAIVVARAAGDRRTESIALGNLGVVLFTGLGRSSEARDAFTAALALGRARGDRRFEANVCQNLAQLDQEEGHLAEAAAGYAAALALHRALGGRRDEGKALLCIATLATQRGRWDEARTGCEAALVILREVGDRFEVTQAVHQLAMQWIERDPARAEAELRVALEMHREVGNRRFEAAVFDALATIRQRAGDHHGARVELGTALLIHRERGNASDLAWALLSLGRSEFWLGEHEAAGVAVSEGIGFARGGGDRRALATLLVLSAELEHAGGRRREARTALAEAEQLAAGIEDDALRASFGRVRTRLSGPP